MSEAEILRKELEIAQKREEYLNSKIKRLEADIEVLRCHCATVKPPTMAERHKNATDAELQELSVDSKAWRSSGWLDGRTRRIVFHDGSSALLKIVQTYEYTVEIQNDDM